MPSWLGLSVRAGPAPVARPGPPSPPLFSDRSGGLLAGRASAILSLRIFSASASDASRIREATPSFLARDREKNVLGPDVVVAKAQRLTKRQLEHLLSARCKRDLTAGGLLTSADELDNLGPDMLERDVQCRQHVSSDALPFAEQAEENVFGPDAAVLEFTRRVLSQDDNLTSFLCESLEHALSIPTATKRPTRQRTPRFQRNRFSGRRRSDRPVLCDPVRPARRGGRRGR